MLIGSLTQHKNNQIKFVYMCELVRLSTVIDNYNIGMWYHYTSKSLDQNSDSE